MTPRLYSVNVRADVMRQIKRDAPATHKFIAGAVTGAYDALIEAAWNIAATKVDTDRECVEAVATYVALKAALTATNR